MSAPVDVLAVMDLAANNLTNLGCRGNGGEVREAHAAVAELIEAADGMFGAAVPSAARWDRLRAAIARIGGAA